MATKGSFALPALIILIVVIIIFTLLISGKWINTDFQKTIAVFSMAFLAFGGIIYAIPK